MTDVFNNETNEVSDGYHTFGELYDHRTRLFALICVQNSENAWKSKLHSDGTMYDGMFVAGVRTSSGDITYHCNDEYWELFKVEELDNAPEWDGHSPQDVCDRLGYIITNNNGQLGGI